jgi:hypothetical protein
MVSREMGRRREEIPTEEYILQYNRLLGQPPQSARLIRHERHGLLLDPRPREVNVEEKQQHSQSDNRRLENHFISFIALVERIIQGALYIKLIMIPH